LFDDGGWWFAAHASRRSWCDATTPTPEIEPSIEPYLDAPHSTMQPPTVNSQPLLHCDRLTRFYGIFPALREVSFQLPAGCLVGLYGPNGAGKSTLLHLLAGVRRPSSGSILLGSARAGSAEARQRTGYLAHDSLLHPHLTVTENLTFYATLYGLPATAVGKALAQTRGEYLAALKVGELSQGMRQKAALARCLLHTPQLLLLDEPFASLDRATVEELQQALAGLRDAGMTILASTHTPQLLEGLADGAMVLERGRLRQCELGLRSAEAGKH